MIELHIDSELKSWIDPLSPEEHAQLEANILAEGCREPIVVWGTYILDGHNRYEICSRHGVEFATVEKTGLVTKDDALVWMAQHQLGKRNLSDFSRVALALRLKPLLEKCAHARMVAGCAPAVDPAQKSAQGSGKTRDELAKRAGVSHDTVHKVEKIIGSGNAEVIAQVRSGEISINAAAKKVAPPRAPAVVETSPAYLANANANANAAASETGGAASCDTIPASESVEVAAPAEPEDAPMIVKMIEVDEEEYNELVADYKRVLAENTKFGDVVEADDQLSAAMQAVATAEAEIAKQKAIAASANQSLGTKMGENNELIRTVRRLTRDIERETKRADDAERQLAQMRSAA